MQVANDGVDDEWVASLSGDADRMVVLVEDDWPLQLPGDGAPCRTDLSEAYLLLALGAVVL